MGLGLSGFNWRGLLIGLAGLAGAIVADVFDLFGRWTGSVITACILAGGLGMLFQFRAFANRRRDQQR